MKAAADNITSLKQYNELIPKLYLAVYFISLIRHESANSSPSLPNHCLWYDKLWGPSQRVVTLFLLYKIHFVVVKIVRFLEWDVLSLYLILTVSIGVIFLQYMFEWRLLCFFIVLSI